MTSFETLVSHEVQALAPELTERFADAQGKASGAISGFSHPPTRRLIAAMTLRAALCEGAAQYPELDAKGWRMQADPHHMMSITLFNADLNMSWKILKERKSYPGGISPARRGTKGAAFFMGMEPLFGKPDVDRLLLLFDIKGWESKEDWEIPLRVVRSLSIPRYGDKVPLDFSLPVVGDAGFYENMPFVPDGIPDEDLFAQVDNEEYQRGG